MPKKTRLFFTAEWEETVPEQAAYVVEITHADNGKVLSSKTYVAQDPATMGQPGRTIVRIREKRG